MQDEEVVGLAKRGHRAAAEVLVNRYRPLVENKAKAYFVVGADHEDVVQEGMIGLCKAIRDFRFDRLSKFRPFAEMCVTRQIITAVKTATRQKHVPLNGYVSLSRTMAYEASDTPLADVIADRETLMPEATCAPHRLPKDLHEMMKQALSDLEHSVLRYYLEGMSYQEMGKRLNCHTKSIDNALQRVKKKISQFLTD